MTETSGNILEIDGIEVVYDNVIAAVHDVSLSVPRGKIVALLGGNGAGKSTTLKAVSTMLASERGKVTRGTITYDGMPVKNQDPAVMVGLGMVQVLEGRRCFGHLTVEENIIAGAYSRKLSKSELKNELEKIYNYFKRLKERRKSQAGYTSGGEQQMLAIARAMMLNPSLLILDEATEGLAPIIRQEVWKGIKSICSRGISALVVDKHLSDLMAIASYNYILENGLVVFDGTTEALQSDLAVQSRYLGV